MDFRNTINMEKKGLLNSSIAKDARCFKRNIAHLDRFEIEHDEYQMQMRVWQSEGKIDSNPSSVAVEGRQNS